MADIPEETTEKVTFKKKTKKQFRKPISPKDSDDSEEEIDSDDVSSKLQEMKNLQKLRKRQHGVSIVSLALGKKVTQDDEVLVSDPFKLKTGGMVHMKALKSGKIKRVDDAYDTGIGTQFSAETNKRDEDEEMMKYIEEQLSKRKGNMNEDEEGNTGEDMKYCSPEEAALRAMLSNQMLSGIPEVDLGIDAKIRNIEATEEAKLKYFGTT
ncbi:hypothetical protein L9F63_002956 [Diploptera punctata]|uniref:Uncharacterized protein n=1 Tax=Diploptera punctata TaxID=6984 RepID=A0AAD7ZRN8_DIPPU|nr:hypothetical protein L9F63_002956 [Diploptera punctata]